MVPHAMTRAAKPATAKNHTLKSILYEKVFNQFLAMKKLAGNAIISATNTLVDNCMINLKKILPVLEPSVFLIAISFLFLFTENAAREYNPSDEIRIAIMVAYCEI